MTLLEKANWSTKIDKSMMRLSMPATSRRTLLAAGLAAAALPVASPAKAAIVNNAVIGSDGWLYAAWDEVRRADPGKMRQVVNVVHQAMAMMRGAGIQVAVSLTPIKARIYPEFLPADFRTVPDAERRYAMTMQELAKDGTLVPDLATAMASMKKAYPGQLLFLKADTHWTAIGAETCAIELGKAIKAKIQLPPSPRPGVAFDQPALYTYEQNDLAELLPGAQQEAYPPQQYWYRPVKAAGQNALLEDDSADVVVIGNSYMQPKFGFANILSNTLNRPVGLSWKIHRYGPYRTLLGYLESENFRRQRPKLIVWNFRESDLEFLPDQSGIWGPNVMPVPKFLADVKKAVS